ncbi:hypothetical protein ACINNAV82_2764 [Acinetobacter baumannii Naval-82]|nr:hypothetical protein ACINNAV82_2764 [Acinetobacter baumannii Naval-82]
MTHLCNRSRCCVHGGIRHLETKKKGKTWKHFVHGGIRHLENSNKFSEFEPSVHGGIRHLERGVRHG